MSDKKSVSAIKVLKSSLKEMKVDPFMYSIFLFPIYLFALVSFSYDDFIIVNNQDFQFYQYSLNSYLIGLIYILIESYVFSIIAVAIHNKIIKKNITLSFFSKGIVIYFLFYLQNHNEFLFYFTINYLPKAPIIFMVLISLIILFFFSTTFLWVLYLPNISVKDNHSFFYIIKNSYGARLTVIIQAIIVIAIFLIPYFILAFLGGVKFGLIFGLPFLFVFGVTMLSHTYLEWQELERNTAETNN